MAKAIVPEIIITDPTDSRLGRGGWIEAGYEQSDPFDSEPIFIVVPTTASDERLAGLAKQFDVAVESLIGFRHDLRNANVLQVLGREMAPRFGPPYVVETKPITSLDDLNVLDLEVVVRFRSGHLLLRQINAVSENAVELVDCWRADRIIVDRCDIDRIDRVGMQFLLGDGVEDGRRVGTVDTHVPGWIRHRQIGRAFIGPDRSRQPWSSEDSTNEAVDAEMA